MKVTEEWRPSPSFSLYEVSSLGRVRRNGRFLKVFFYRRRFCVAVNHPRRQAIPVSTLIAEAFLGLANPNARRTTFRIIYRNDDPSDNRPANLLIVPRRHCLVPDLQRANQLLEDGVGPELREKLTGVTAGQLRRYRRREGCAARPRAESPERQLLRQLEALLGVSRGKVGGASDHRQPEEP